MRYDRLGASSRLRFFQYVEFLERSGFDVSISPLFGDDYVRALYSKPPSQWSIVKAYWHRFLAMLSFSKFDVLWVEKELLPFFPSWIEQVFIPNSVALVVDYDDAWFHRYDRHRYRWVRAVLGGKIDRVMARADLVIAGNEYLAKRAYDAGAKRVRLLPTVVDLQRYPSKERDLLRSPLVVGWMGSPATAKYLEALFPVADRLSREYLVEFVAVGATASQVAGSVFRAQPWTEDGEYAQLCHFDIGIMPLPDEDWERGKCGYKLIQYMASGLPVVASPVGMNTQIVAHGRNGYLATTPEEWWQSLSSLLKGAEQRVQFGEEGRRRVVLAFSLAVTQPLLCEYLAACVKPKIK